MRKIETYWYFWGVLVASLIFAVILGIQADWSHAMKKRISLGFAKEVTSPVIALELAGNSDDFQHVLGISLPTDGAARRNDLPVEPEASLSDIERDVQSFDAIFLCDYAFLVLYAILLLLLISHLRTSGAIRSKSAGGLLAALVIVAAIADAVENTVARGPISKALDVLSKTYSEVQELAAQERVEQTRRLEQDGKAAAPQLEASGVKAPDLKADWAALNNRKIVTFSTTSKGVDTMVREAIREKVNAPTVDQIRLSANPKEALRALDEAGYLVLSGKEVQPGPESEVKSAAENPREYTLQELRRVCQVPGQALRISSLIKWGVASVLSVVLGWLMLRSNYSLPESKAAMSLREAFQKYIIKSPSAPAGVDRCLGGLLLIIGGGTCLAGVFIWPICIESGFLFIMAAFLPLLIGGLHQIVNRPQASVVTQAEESAEGLAYG